MELNRIFLLIADISGYTNFVSEHKFSLLHAEHIIGNLLEAVIRESEVPLQVHELLGDAVTMFAVSEAEPEIATKIYRLMQRMRETFQLEEGKHISDCSRCSCDACRAVDQLKLKIIVHHGEVAMTEVAGIRKISGEPVIQAHRLLKNEIASRDYFLITPEVHDLLPEDIQNTFTGRTEKLEGLGERRIYFHSFEPVEERPTRGFVSKMRRALAMDLHVLRSKLGVKQPEFKHLPEAK